MTTRHRKCGCDCNDQTRWVEDDGITQATFECGCEDGKKPPCVYWANFECDVTYLDRASGGTDVFPLVSTNIQIEYARGVPSLREQLRPTCKWGPDGRYVSLKGNIGTSPAAYNGGCTWDDVLSLGNSPLRSDAASWDYLDSQTRWALTITDSPVTMTHFGGAKYAQKTEEQWDCFGPNTLWLDKDPSEYSSYSTLPTFVCVTPSVFAVKNEPASCNQCYSTILPAISTASGKIPSQTLQFLKTWIEEGSSDSLNGGSPFLENSMQSPYLFQYIQADNTFDGGRAFAVLQFLDAIQAQQTSRASITFVDDGSNNAAGTRAIGYYCDQFACGSDNVFVSGSTAAGWPATLTLEPGDCTRSNQYQWGPCWNSSGSTSWEEGYPRGETEESRKNCCDPWCSCAPGWLKVFNPSGSYLSQTFGGITTGPTTFCEGGRYGLNSPSSVSREWCVENVYAADGTTHEVCMVLYCGSLGGGVTWLIDWYCDGTFVATRNMNQVLNCCPNQMAQLGPEMPCLPGAVLCVGINIEPACEPLPPCCDLADYQSTLTLSMYTTGCAGWPATVTLTQSGSQFTGSFIVGVNTVTILFDAVNPVNGFDCGIKFTCSATGANQAATMTSVSCSPPTLTGTVNLGLTFGCGCGVLATVLCILNTP